MAAKYILGVLAVLFLVLASVRLLRDGGRLGPAVKAWFMVGGLFAAVAAWLIFNQP